MEGRGIFPCVYLGENLLMYYWELKVTRATYELRNVLVINF
jgi:hypothetical protein